MLRRMFVKGLGISAAAFMLPDSMRAIGRAIAQSNAPSVAGAAPPPAPLLERLATLGDNQWLDPEPAPRIAYQSTACETCTEPDWHRELDDPNPVNRNWSGIVPGDDFVFNFGGGHNTHPGNDVDLYVIPENRWEVQYSPEVPAYGTVEFRKVTQGGSASTPTPLGRPWCQHSHQEMAWDAVRRRIISVFKSGTWAYDISSRTWTLLAGPLVGTFSPTWAIAAGLVMYDAVRERIFAIKKQGTGRGIYEFDADTNRWSASTPFPPGLDLNGRAFYAAAAPDRDEVYAFLYRYSSVPHYRLFRYRRATGQWDQVVTLPGPLQTRNPIFDYDTFNRRVVMIQPQQGTHPLEVWTWDPGADTWSQLPQSGPRPTSRRGMGRRVFVYVATHNIFVCLDRLSLYCDGSAYEGRVWCGGRTKTWIYRLGNTGAA